MAAQGFIEQLIVDGEVVSINGISVWAIVDRQPRLFDMQDAGYLDKEPMNIEVLKGYSASTEMFGNNPIDLRGFTPQPRKTLATIGSVARKVMTVQDCVDRWILTTRILNT